MPDPVLSVWKKNDDKLKKQGVSKKDRPVKPERNPEYPTKVQIALNLLQEFNDHHNEIQVQAVLADALYGEGHFINQASKIFGGIQVISQLSNNQNISAIPAKIKYMIKINIIQVNKNYWAQTVLPSKTTFKKNG